MKSFLMGGGTHSARTFLSGGFRPKKIIGGFLLNGKTQLNGTSQLGAIK
jgi:hypothetical protein